MNKITFVEKGDIVKWNNLYSLVVDTIWVQGTLKLTLITQCNFMINNININELSDDIIYNKKYLESDISNILNVSNNLSNGFYDNVFEDFKSKYVLCCAFDGTKIISILKNRPDYQKNKLNGIGGKVENDETYIEAMIREFKEETSVSTFVSDWSNFAVLVNDFFIIECFKTNISGLSKAVQNVTDEKLVILDYNDIHDKDLVNNYKMLLEIALNNSIKNKIEIRIK